MKEVVKAYAKVNLGLEVVKKSKSNYHKLRMVMTTIDLYDEIIFEQCDDIIIETNKYICEYENNLCYKVATYLKKTYNIDQGIKIYIYKNIPDGGGLGGGSSDAAEVLKYLNKYWNLNLNNKELKKIGFMFGCDIPYFIEGKCAYVYGYGEKIKNIKQRLEERDILIVVPNFSLSTGNVFSTFDNKTTYIRRDIKKIIKNINESEYYFNDLENAANYLSNEQIMQTKKQIEDMKIGKCVMTGSGSCIICYIEKDLNFDENNFKKYIPNCKIIKSKLKVYSY